MNKSKIRLKIAASLLLSLFIVVFFSPMVFVEKSTAIRPSVLASIRVVPYSVFAYLRHPTNQSERESIIETARIQEYRPSSELNYTPVSTGVYAAYDLETGETVVKIDEGTELEVKTITFSDGRSITVYVPVK